jgi:tRNA C32,U32 (ribose-2'-O)-methylase TrmJ
MYHIAEGIQKELNHSLQKDIDNHQDIQAMTWELKEVIDTMTMNRMTKEKIIYTLRKVLDKYEWEWREPLFLTNIQAEQIKPL